MYTVSENGLDDTVHSSLVPMLLPSFLSYIFTLQYVTNSWEGAWCSARG